MKNALLAGLLSLLPIWAASQYFLEDPYLQLGDNASRADELSLLWQTEDQDSAWSVEVRSTAEGNWTKTNEPTYRHIVVGGVEPHRVYAAKLTGLAPGGEFEYRVMNSGKQVFDAKARARHSANQPYRFVAFGDCGADTPNERAVAYQTSLAKPDFVFIAGDIVYSAGRISEYRKKYFPIYNAEKASAFDGAPLLRSIPFIAAGGNHDLAPPAIIPGHSDRFAYFYYWSQPLNGPLTTPGAANTPALKGDEIQSAGDKYPRMANFSFDYGNAHWLVLDSNAYVDWNDAKLREWVENDLKSAQGATWRIVGFHHPGFNSSRAHFKDQWMRGLSPLFEKYGVDLVLAGHVHNYQRTYPLKYEHDGTWTLDKTYDGKNKTKPNGVIYLVTGGGGAGLYDANQEKQPETWQTFTMKFTSSTHSLTVVDVDGKKLTARQLAENGNEVDHFVVTK
jgi:acid phosphatase type 7